MKFILMFLVLIPSISFADNFLINSNKLFAVAEKSYPEFFSPAGMQTISLDNYLVRYYPNTGNYIGTTGEYVYVYGDTFNGLLRVGSIPDFIELEPDGDELLARLFNGIKHAGDQKQNAA